MTMHGKIIQITGEFPRIVALTSLGKIIKLDFTIVGEPIWKDFTPDVVMTDRERELLNSLEEK